LFTHRLGIELARRNPTPPDQPRNLRNNVP